MTIIPVTVALCRWPTSTTTTRDETTRTICTPNKHFPRPPSSTCGCNGTYNRYDRVARRRSSKFIIRRWPVHDTVSLFIASFTSVPPSSSSFSVPPSIHFFTFRDLLDTLAPVFCFSPHYLPRLLPQYTPRTSHLNRSRFYRPIFLALLFHHLHTHNLTFSATHNIKHFRTFRFYAKAFLLWCYGCRCWWRLPLCVVRRILTLSHQAVPAVPAGTLTIATDPVQLCECCLSSDVGGGAPGRSEGMTKFQVGINASEML